MLLVSELRLGSTAPGGLARGLADGGTAQSPRACRQVEVELCLDVVEVVARDLGDTANSVAQCVAVDRERCCRVGVLSSVVKVGR